MSESRFMMIPGANFQASIDAAVAGAIPTASPAAPGIPRPNVGAGTMDWARNGVPQGTLTIQDMPGMPLGMNFTKGPGQIGNQCTGSTYDQCISGCCVGAKCAPRETCFGPSPLSTPPVDMSSLVSRLGVAMKGKLSNAVKRCNGSTYEQCPNSGCCIDGACQRDGYKCFGRERL